jgi:hypothetical protein
VLVLVFVGIHRRAKSDQIVRGLLVLDTEVSSAVYFGGERRIPFVPQCPVDSHGVILVGLEEPLLVRREWGTVLLIGTSVEGAREQIAVEAHTGLKEGVWAFDAIANEGG